MVITSVAGFTCSLLMALSAAHAGSDQGDIKHQLLPGNRVLMGTVEEVRSDQARINTGEGQPRFIPMNVRKDKGLLDLKKGDQVELTVNDQNLLVDVHKAGEASHHRVIRGQLAGPLETGHEKAVIRTQEGKEESHQVRPVARSKVASIPVGADVTFLIDELDKIVDVTMGTTESVHRAAELGQQKSPLKGNLNQIVGVITKPLKDNTIVIRTEGGNEQSYEVRPLVQERLAKLSRGDSATLLVDEEHKVADVSFN
ncbi:MAG: hypothetical protein M3M98_02105, partial [Nitrospirota bacterium]|nr:hypothetical protein [Nitrospirota bacterium]